MQLPSQLCQDFLNSVNKKDESGGKHSNKNILKEELLEFINRGINMTIGERKEYASRGELQKIIVSFFEGINEARVEFRNSEKFVRIILLCIHKGSLRIGQDLLLSGLRQLL